MFGFRKADHAYSDGSHAFGRVPAAQHGRRAACALLAALTHVEMKQVLPSPGVVLLLLGTPFLTFAVLVLVFAACPLEDVALPLCLAMGDAGTYLIPCHALPMM